MTQIIDVHAYVGPAMELIYETATPEFRGQWAMIEQMLELAEPIPGIGDWDAPYLYLPPQPHQSVPGAWPEPVFPAGVEPPAVPLNDIEPRVLHDNPGGRLAAMDRAGVTCQVISPGPSIDACIGLPSNIAAGVLGAYNRYILSYCGHAPDRLKAVLQLHAGEPHWSAREVEDLVSDECVAAVAICMPVKLAPDARDLQPLWDALDRTRTPVLQRPGIAARVWTPERLLTYLNLTGVLARYPHLRIGFAGSGVAHLGSLTKVLSNGHREFRGDGAPKFYLTANGGDSAAEIAAAVAAMGAECLLWESRFPYCNGSYSPGPALERLDSAQRTAVLGENARRYFAHV
ncbi:MAG: amidohydrolase family protein [Solirubrobacteraceae bacterium]